MIIIIIIKEKEKAGRGGSRDDVLPSAGLKKRRGGPTAPGKSERRAEHGSSAPGQ